jgi:uncharacterized membrane protein YcaP (DUF421 family)
MNELWEGIRWLAEPHRGPQLFSLPLICLRAAAVYIAGWALLRLGGNRFLGRETVFDIVLAFVLGSTLSRGINGSAPLLITLAACALLVVLHHLFAWVSWRSRRWGKILKGRPLTIIQDGLPLKDALRRYRISDGDLEEALRLVAHLKEPDRVAEARFERNGEISVIQKREAPRILEVRVQEGVQTVRIELQA